MPAANTPSRRKTGKTARHSPSTRRQFFRYLLVGGGSFALEYGGFFLLLQVFQFHYLIANSLVYSIVSALNFSLNRLWTFHSSTRLRRQILLYLTLLLFNMLASNFILYILCDPLQLPALLAKIAVMAMVVAWNFILYKTVIYR